MKPSALLTVLFASTALAKHKKETKAPTAANPSLQDAVVCFSKHLVISYVDGFTSQSTQPADPPKTRTLPRPTQSRHSLTTITTLLPGESTRTTHPATVGNIRVRTAEGEGEDEDEDGDGSGSEDEGVLSRHKKPFTCSFSRSYITWKSHLRIPFWLSTSASVTATLNSWITTTQLTTVETEYWSDGTTLTSPPTTVPDPPETTPPTTPVTVGSDGTGQQRREKRGGQYEGGDEDGVVTSSDCGDRTAIVYITITETVTETSSIAF
ncbi:hypothetical protein F5Y10DRAFT_43824 [Nemania abortiva]|nr:hypothetical protein F5Y10DRAFT_43824 [Nemania abortiva]